MVPSFAIKSINGFEAIFCWPLDGVELRDWKNWLKFCRHFHANQLQASTFFKDPKPFLLYYVQKRKLSKKKNPFSILTDFSSSANRTKQLWYQKLIFTWKCLIENSGAPLWIRGEADFFSLRLSNQLWKCVIIMKKQNHSLEDIFFKNEVS